jgi:hypothetical protein
MKDFKFEHNLLAYEEQKAKLKSEFIKNNEEYFRKKYENRDTNSYDWAIGVVVWVVMTIIGIVLFINNDIPWAIIFEAVGLIVFICSFVMSNWEHEQNEKQSFEDWMKGRSIK